MRSTGSEFLWSDAWLLLAISATRKATSASLAETVAAGDAINHAVFTREELSGAINRLGRAGYLSWVEPNELMITSSGAAILREVMAAAAGWHDRQARLEQLLNIHDKTPRPDPRKANDGEEWSLAQSVYDSALQHYLAR
jgi:hypothetical protein